MKVDSNSDLPLAPLPSLNSSADSLQQARTVLSNYSPLSAQDKTKDVLVALLDHAPSESGRDNIVQEIITIESCEALAEHLAVSFLAPCMFLSPLTLGVVIMAKPLKW